jgi:osmotically-inducible protein OsmY
MSTVTMARTDEEIQRDILEELKWDARVQPNEVGVAVKSGVVTLFGWVDSFAKKWAAERAAHRVKGVVAVANDIEVRLPSTAERTDAEIAAAVTRALEWDAFVPIEHVDVTVARGWVTLRGEVDWEFQRRAADRAVRRLAGVRGVTTLITVRPPTSPAPSPDQLKRRIEEALIRSAETDAERITIDVDGDTVILKGTVHSWAEREEAERVAWSSPGVSTVHNRIEVIP